MKKIVILGGCGYIGSALFPFLLKRNYIVDTVDLEWFGNYVNPNNIKCDYNDLPKSFFDGYDTVVLLAGHSTVGMCKKEIADSLKNNVENFVLLMQKLKKQKFIYASTYRLYDGIGDHQVKESENLKEPSSIYTLTKKMIDSYIAFTSLEYYSLRMATVNGYSPNLRVNQIINKIFLDATTNKKTRFFDPLAIFSILGIEDLSRVVEQIILGGDQRGIYNLSSFESSIHQIVNEMSKDVQSLNISIKKSSFGDYHMRIDTTKFKKIFNFTFLETVQSIVNSLEENFSKNSHVLKSI